MSEDARFEDGREAPVNIGAYEADEVPIISALVQDAVFPISEMSWGKTQRRFALLVNRFRWEDDGRDRHKPERVQAVHLVPALRIFLGQRELVHRDQAMELVGEARFFHFQVEAA